MKQQIAELFKGFKIRKPVFYSWPLVLRIELSGDLPQEKEAIKQATDRAVAIYKYTFEPNDDVVFVAQRLNESEMVKNDYLSSCISGLWSVPKETEVIKHLYDEDSPNARRYYFKMKAKNVDPVKLFSGIAAADFAIEPNIGWETYLFNLSKKCMLHMYDDRGMDLIAQEKETLKPIYVTFNSWLLNYDRKAMDRIFNCE